ncbi:hypothetical protein B0O99DRAFT_622534 [Bisporella sp. PMI_857]|nr:hypothetical protein B0O99DRAFT_622534 [Bisporella sp. PMI_857]
MKTSSASILFVALSSLVTALPLPRDEGFAAARGGTAVKQNLRSATQHALGTMNSDLEIMKQGLSKVTKEDSMADTLKGSGKEPTLITQQTRDVPDSIMEVTDPEIIGRQTLDDWDPVVAMTNPDVTRKRMDTRQNLEESESALNMLVAGSFDPGTNNISYKMM